MSTDTDAMRNTLARSHAIAQAQRFEPGPAELDALPSDITPFEALLYLAAIAFGIALSFVWTMGLRIVIGWLRAIFARSAADIEDELVQIDEQIDWLCESVSTDEFSAVERRIAELEARASALRKEKAS